MHNDNDFGVIFEQRDGRFERRDERLELAALERYRVRSRSWRYRLARIVEWPAVPFLWLGEWLRGER